MSNRYPQSVGSPDEHRPDDTSPVQFDKLNGLGKTVFTLAAAGDLAARGIDALLGRAARIAADSERAFRQGRSGDVIDAEWKDVGGSE
jgi:hypothetical protein